MDEGAAFGGEAVQGAALPGQKVPPVSAVEVPALPVTTGPRPCSRPPEDAETKGVLGLDSSSSCLPKLCNTVCNMVLSI